MIDRGLMVVEIPAWAGRTFSQKIQAATSLIRNRTGSLVNGRVALLERMCSLMTLL